MKWSHMPIVWSLQYDLIRGGAGFCKFLSKQKLQEWLIILPNNPFINFCYLCSRVICITKCCKYKGTISFFPYNEVSVRHFEIKKFKSSFDAVFVYDDEDYALIIKWHTSIVLGDPLFWGLKHSEKCAVRVLVKKRRTKPAQINASSGE